MKKEKNIFDYSIGSKLEVKANDGEVYAGVLIDFADTFYDDPENGVVIEAAKDDIIVIYQSEIKEIKLLSK